jgi:hypothetical protein
MTTSTAAQFFAGNDVGLQTFTRVHEALLQTYPDVTVRVSRSQVSFRRRRGFAYLWVPGQYLRRPAAPVVLSVATRQRIGSPRFKEVVRPGPWMHHLEITAAAEVDEEVLGWLAAAAEDG